MIKMLSVYDVLSHWKIVVPAFFVLYLICRAAVTHLLQKESELPPHLQAQREKCRPAYRWKTLDPFFGLDVLYDSYIHFKAHTLLDRGSQNFAKFGKTFLLRLLGQTIIVTIEPENVKTVLATEFKSWELGEERKQMLMPLLGEGIFLEEGDKWRWSRQLLRPCFDKSRVRAVQHFEPRVQELCARIRDFGTGAMVNLQPLFTAISMDLSTKFMFGESSGMLLPKVDPESIKDKNLLDGQTRRVSSQGFVEAYDYCIDRIRGERQRSRGFLLDMFMPDPNVPRYQKIVHDYVDDIIARGFKAHEAYQENAGEKSDYLFLQELFEHTDNHLKIRHELLSLLLAGRDTTASLLTNLWWEISRHPEVWKELQSEIAFLGNRAPTYDELKAMKYLNVVVKEALRLYPVLPANSRQAIEDTVLPTGGGPDGKSPILVKKGWILHWHLWTIHRRQDFFGGDAAIFRPSRWLDGPDGRKGLRVGWEYLPFNGGPRICVAQQFALIEAYYVTVRLLQEFAGGIESRDSEPWREKIGIAAIGLNGCKVVLHDRPEKG